MRVGSRNPRIRTQLVGAGILILAFCAGPGGSQADSPGNDLPASPTESAIGHPAPAHAFCTLASCRPRPGDSPWTLASFAAAALAAAWLGNRRSSLQGRAHSSKG